MDEVDGLGISDRGGNAEIAKFIRGTKVPIICICNDRQKASVRTLANYCYDIKMHAPTTEQIRGRLAFIAKNEGVGVEEAALTQLIESVGGDLRQAINTLQMWAVTERVLSASAFKSRAGTLGKDMNLRLDAFSATPRMFNVAQPLGVREELFFVDYDMIPLLIQQVRAGVCACLPVCLCADVRVTRVRACVRTWMWHGVHACGPTDVPALGSGEVAAAMLSG
jgi:replication factor C subunit 1